MILLGIFAGLFIKILIPGLGLWVYTLIRLLVLPLLVGVGYEVIMLAGKHNNFLTRAISAPGLWVQKITTKEPTLDMLEVAITSIKCALRDDFPEFQEFYESCKPLMKSDEKSTEAPKDDKAESPKEEDEDADGKSE
jgi:uncharacterized protein YqhQ